MKSEKQPPEQPPGSPPRWPYKLLKLFCAPDLREEVLGDLHERYYRRVERLGEVKARRYYWREVLSYIRLSAIQRKSTHSTTLPTTAMLVHYLIIAIRNLRKQPFYALINILGLAIGLAACLLIGLYVMEHRRFDRFHERAGQIYRVNYRVNINGEESDLGATPPPLAQTLMNEFPEVERATRIFPGVGNTVRYGDKVFEETAVIAADSNFFRIFSFRLVAGDVNTVLREPNTVVLTRASAEKYFGTEPAMGKVLAFGEEQRPVTVVGIAENPPVNSHFTLALIRKQVKR
jgi:putative ABC transport system permease protein